jgi:RND family efflux transporter MFP subunit
MVTAFAARPAAVLLIAAALSTLAACGEGRKQSSALPPPTVTVAKPVQRTVVDQDEYVGRFVAIDSVEVRSRVSGYLAEIRFTDGQMVKKGDLLFVIDHRPFQIVLDQMRANLAQARANLAFTEADLARGQELVHNKTITEQSYDQRKQAKSVAEAAVAAQEAMVHSAELDLNEFSELRAPIDGRIGDRRVSIGNLVTGGNGANTTMLATIV